MKARGFGRLLRALALLAFCIHITGVDAHRLGASQLRVHALDNPLNVPEDEGMSEGSSNGIESSNNEGDNGDDSESIDGWDDTEETGPAEDAGGSLGQDPADSTGPSTKDDASGEATGPEAADPIAAAAEAAEAAQERASTAGKKISRGSK